MNNNQIECFNCEEIYEESEIEECAGCGEEFCENCLNDDGYCSECE
ncbi:MAG: hypothetical protein I3273_04725 [Candidatus Moeniiplasma glomeromycotorum]|nr:hypothetical protein [Candidatus Moeniiplasma glomeromycotorum]MCE8169398.1 hypothetical protein [Candidatus Moeniiplasma glomeromycotorum]